MPEPQQSERGFTGTLKSRWGPLPVWGWLLVVTILALGYYLWTRRQGAQQQTAPMSGQPGVVVINQAGQPQPGVPPPVKPPKPPEDHDKDENGESRGHDDDDHHRHRRHRRDDDDRGQPQPPPIGAPPPTGTGPPPPTGTGTGTVNVGSLFPKITPATGSGGRGRKRG